MSLLVDLMVKKLNEEPQIVQDLRRVVKPANVKVVTGYVKPEVSYPAQLTVTVGAEWLMEYLHQANCPGGKILIDGIGKEATISFLKETTDGE